MKKRSALRAPKYTGDVYVAGGFITYNSVLVDHIVRVNPDRLLPIPFLRQTAQELWAHLDNRTPLAG